MPSTQRLEHQLVIHLPMNLPGLRETVAEVCGFLEGMGTPPHWIDVNTNEDGNLVIKLPTGGADTAEAKP